jgi:C-terminal processing protease CtpA/Prc
MLSTISAMRRIEPAGAARRWRWIWLWLGFPAVPAAAGDAPVLTQSEMQEVLRTLQTQFAQPDAVSFAALNRAAIEGLLRNHPDTIQLLTVPDGGAADVPVMLTESLTPQIACVRPGAFRREAVEPLKSALTKLAAGGTRELILDLRAPAADGDPAAAVPLAALFLPPGTPVISSPTPLKTSVDSVWTGGLVVLADRETCNVAEILAAVLKAKQRALFIGETTRGRTAAISELPLRKSEGGHLVLRYAAQRVVIADGPDPFGKGIAPDISAAVPPDAKRAVFELQAREGLARGVFQQARPRLNEAALVARTNPEIPERLARTAGNPVESDAPLIDRPLQLAVDILVARRLLEPDTEK